MSNVIDPNAVGSENQESVALTQEDVVKVVNSAITSHLKRLDFNKQITSALDTHLAPFKEMLGKVSEDKSIVSKESIERSAPSPEISAMHKKMEAMEKQFKAREEALTAKERAASEKSAFAKVKSELTSFQGVRTEAVDPLAKLLKAEGRIHIDEEGEVSYLDDDGESTLDLKAGLKKYLDPKSNPVAGLYLAPKSPGERSALNKMNRSTSGRTLSTDENKNLPPAQRAALQLERMGLKV